MPLPAERPRLEWLLRIIASIAMIGLVFGAFAGPGRFGGVVLDGENLPAALGQWMESPPADTLGLRLEAPLNGLTRAWIRALRANGTRLAWASGGIAPLMLEAEPLEDPAGGALVRLSGPDGLSLFLADSLGLLDSVRLTEPGMTLRVPAFSGGLAARAATTQATVPPFHPRPEKSVVVLGMAGWESKFTIRALEERGWKVESRIAIAPRLATTQGRPFPLDTSRQAAVIALDSSVAAYAEPIHQFVRSGGGLVLGDAAVPYLERSAPASLATVVRPAGLSTSNRDFRQMLTFRALRPVRVGAMGLEERNGEVTVAAWRLSSGRVVQVGYRDIWRWRMEGGGNSAVEHRDWWARLVAMVAYRSPSPRQLAADPAPLASLVQALGPPSSLPSGRPTRSLWPVWLTVFLVSLFGEWLSRRLGGAA